MPMKNSESVRRLRIIVALNACRRDLGGLELAANLAARKGCELEALFVEEVNLINVADLPFTKEVARSSGTERAFDQPRIERAQRASLSQIQQAIDRFNDELQVRASLKVVRGHFVRTALAIEDDVEVLVLSRRGEARAGKSGTAAGFPGTHALGPAPIWAIVDGTEESLLALEAAVEVAAAEPARLIVAVPGNRANLIDKVRSRLAAAAGPNSSSTRIITVEPFDASTLLRQIRQSGCRLLFVKRADGELLEQVADAAECPVVLV